MDSEITLGEKEEKGIEEIKDICSHYVEVILEMMGVNATRLAIVPVYRYRGDHASYIVSLYLDSKGKALI